VTAITSAAADNRLRRSAAVSSEKCGRSPATNPTLALDTSREIWPGIEADDGESKMMVGCMGSTVQLRLLAAQFVPLIFTRSSRFDRSHFGGALIDWNDWNFARFLDRQAAEMIHDRLPFLDFPNLRRSVGGSVTSAF
jgi:hypothetical protein